ncbi:MAG: carbonic anhydrase family protein [Planctomycetes bacterium]|nr:carbonic anhydrase family protein [Planctomycetota bacterium]
MKYVWFLPALVCVSIACPSRQESNTRAASPVASATVAKAEWSYGGETGPEHWGDLSPSYVLAKTGRQQSPVDIVASRAIRKDLAALNARYDATSLEILNNGHTVEVDYHGRGVIAVDGREYELAQFHFHSPSEHTIDGEHAPMELHLVHTDAGGHLAVIGVLIREGRPHPELALLWRHLPAAPFRKEAVEGVQVDASNLLPGSLASYRYSGSLTTPPCSEGVSWFVLQAPIEASAGQIAAFREVIHGNNRPIQPLNGRTITASR